MRRCLACLALLFLCLVAVSACTVPFVSFISGPSGSSATMYSTTPLSGTSWALTRLTVGGRSQPPAPTAPITLQFQRSDSGYLGSSGCNYYNGIYTLSGDDIHMRFSSVTQRACAGPIMSQEVTYLNAMEQARSFQIETRTLTLRDEHGNVILAYSAA